jgi:hypothetical protein
MKMYSSRSRFAAIATLSLLLFTASCKKEAAPSTDNTQAAELVVEAGVSEAFLQSAFDDVFDNAAGIDGATAGEDLGIYGNTGFGIFPGQATVSGTEEPATRCFIVTVTPKERGVFPKTVVIDFGTGCETRGHLRKGKIITVYSGPLHMPGKSAVTTFDGYQVDSFKIEGKHTILNSTEPGGNQRSFTRSVENAKITNVNTSFWRSWSGIRVMTQLEGNGTPLFPLDDVYQFTGGMRGGNANGRSWSSTIVNPLIKAFTCSWISQGTIEIRVNDTVGVLDFGNGACDNAATVTVNGVSREISLR